MLVSSQKVSQVKSLREAFASHCCGPSMLMFTSMFTGKTVINFDESTIDLTSYLRRGWGRKGKYIGRLPTV